MRPTDPTAGRSSRAVDEPLVIDVRIEAPGWSTRPGDAPGLCRRAAQAAFHAAAAGRTGDEPRSLEASILLTDDARIRDLNRAYRGQDKPTNVLSFAQEAIETAPLEGDLIGSAPPPVPLGDIVVALETAVDEADADAIPLADHVSHLVVHGMLHLLGYDHEDDADAAVMERLETEILATLGIADPYRDRPRADDDDPSER